MPTPIPPGVFKDLTPRVNASLCGKFLPTLADFMRRFADYYEYVYAQDGSFTEQFVRDLCSVGCSDVSQPECPNEIRIDKLVVGNNGVELELYVNGKLPFDYAIYRSQSENGPWGNPIKTGTSNYNTVSYLDTNIVNGQTYYYKVEANKPLCSQVGKVSSPIIVPTFCLLNVNNVDVAVEPKMNGGLFIRIEGKNGYVIPSTTEAVVYRSITENELGDIVYNGVKPRPGYNYFILNDDAPEPGRTYYYTIRLRERTICDWVEFKKSGIAFDCNPWPRPDVTVINYPPRFEWPSQENLGVTQYEVYVVSKCGGGQTINIDQCDSINNVVRIFPAAKVSNNKWAVNLPYIHDLPYNCYGWQYRTTGATITPGLAFNIVPGSLAHEAFNTYAPLYTQTPQQGTWIGVPRMQHGILPFARNYVCFVIGFNSTRTKKTTAWVGTYPGLT